MDEMKPLQVLRENTSLRIIMFTLVILSASLGATVISMDGEFDNARASLNESSFDGYTPVNEIPNNKLCLSARVIPEGKDTYITPFGTGMLVKEGATLHESDTYFICNSDGSISEFSDIEEIGRLWLFAVRSCSEPIVEVKESDQCVEFGSTAVSTPKLDLFAEGGEGMMLGMLEHEEMMLENCVDQ